MGAISNITDTRALDPLRCALLIIDMQNRFQPIAGPIAAKVASFGEFLLDIGRPVYLTMHHDNEDITTELIKFWGKGERIDKGSAEWQLMPEIAPLKSKGGVVIDRKTSYDAFYLTNLERELRNKGVDQVIITGTVTNLCCETTARSAMVRNFQVFFIDDLNAAATVDHHEASVANLRFGFATILTEEQARQVLQTPKPEISHQDVIEVPD